MALRLVVAGSEVVAERFARAVLAAAGAAIRERGEFRLALSGGSTPRPAYEMLAREQNVAWARWRVFFSDERCVAPDDPRSNYHLAEQALLAHVDIPRENVHRMLGERDPEEAARQYEVELGSEPLDVVLLGMGEDGHTASLFPGSSALDERSRLVVAARAPVVPERRLTLTFPALDAARAAYFLVCGATKASRLAEVLTQRERGRPELPAARVDARSVVFYVDAEAASKVRQP